MPPDPNKRNVVIASLVFLFGLVVAAGASLPAAQDPELRGTKLLISAAEVPDGTYLGVVLDLPYALRTNNWGGGSCVHASNVNLLKDQGLMDLADWWRKNYSGGEYDDRLIKRLEAAGVRYAYAHGGADADGNGRDDGEEFLEWCVRTRRGAGIFYKPSHSINLVGLDRDYAYLLDNNYTDYPERHGTYERVPREEFFRRWHGYGGFGWTLVYDPAPPVPFVEE